MKTKRKIIFILVLALLGMCTACTPRKIDDPSAHLISDITEDNIESRVFLSAAKEDNIYDMQNADGQEVVLLGTLHDALFKAENNYTLEDIQSCIQNEYPDLVLIEARESTYDQYGIIDGPAEMLFVYSYCKENHIPVDLIDWWHIDENHKENTTDDERDTHIHENIMNKINEYRAGKVIVITGNGHLQPQILKLVQEGYSMVDLSHPLLLFNHRYQTFSYPASMKEMLDKRINYIKNDMKKEYEKCFPEIVQNWDQASKEMVDYYEQLKTDYIEQNKVCN